MVGRNAKPGHDMDETEAELRGRLAMLETLVSVTIAHMAALTDHPETIIRQVMANTESMLERARETAPAGEERAAEFAQAAFDAIGDAMMAHLTARARPAGRG